MKWKREEIARFAATLGVAMLVAGVFRYSMENELTRYTMIILIAGGIVTLAAVIIGIGGIIRFFTKRSSQLGTNTVVLAVAVIAILSAANFLGYRHHKRFDLTTEKLFTLSDQTQKIVGGLQKDVTIIRFAKTADTDLNDLMTEYNNLSPHIKFQNVNPDEKPEILKQYGATGRGDMIVASGARTEHVEPGGFEGGFSEQDITSAILKVSREKNKMACFVEGHGEKSLTSQDESGLSQVDAGLKREGFLTQSINLVSQNGVPSECDAVVIPGPTKAFFPQEEDLLRKFLDGGGRVLILLDPEADSKLDGILQSWNIEAGKNFVIDASGVGQLVGTGPAIPLVVEYGASPITKGLQRKMTFFPLARTVSIADKSKTDPEAVEILKTSRQSFTKAKLEKTVKYDPKTDAIGPLSLGVAASRKTDDKTSRLVVIGNSVFASNQAVGQAANGDLFFNAMDWLLGDENLISVRPKSPSNRRVNLTAAQGAVLKWVDLILLPGLVILSGVWIWWKRR